jgi:tungstate transport system ATP-binding protein
VQVNVPAVEARGLVKRYGEVTVLDLPQLDLAPGRTHVLVGPNGSGKTTLLRIVNGLDLPDSGSVRVLGAEIRPGGRAPTLGLQRRMAFCPEKPYLFQTTVRRNVEYPLRARGVEKNERRARAEAAMEKLGVLDLAERDARSLSAGETQRAAMARAVVSEPELLLMDEPLANVDGEAAALVEDVLLGLASNGLTVVAATHVLEQAYRLSANVVRLEAGRIAPPTVENVLDGEIVPGDAPGEGGPSAVMVLDGGVSVHVTTEKRGRARAAVDPRDIIVSADRFESSARNVLHGRVVSLRERGGLVYVAAGVGGDANGADGPPHVELTSVVTPESCAKLGLTVGSEVVFAFKATAVQIF